MDRHPDRGILWSYPKNAVIPVTELFEAPYRTAPDCPTVVSGLIREGEPDTYPRKGDLLCFRGDHKTPLSVTKRTKDGRTYEVGGEIYGLGQVIEQFEYYPMPGDTVIVKVSVWERWLGSQLTPELRGVDKYPSRAYGEIQAKLDPFADRKWICSEFVLSRVGQDGMATLTHSNGEGRERVPVGCLRVLRKNRGVSL